MTGKAFTATTLAVRGETCDACRMNEQSEQGAPEWDLADRMRKSLRHAGIRPSQMADYLGVGANTVSTWINGRVRPSTQTLRLWALRCGVPFDWLRGGNQAQMAGFRSERSSFPKATLLTLLAV